jgi:cell envelope opacity-associated protein A
MKALHLYERRKKMAINPVLGPSVPLPVKQADQNVHNKANHPAVAPQNNVANDGDKDDKSLKKAAPVQPRESKSQVEQTINKFV